MNKVTEIAISMAEEQSDRKGVVDFYEIEFWINFYALTDREAECATKYIERNYECLYWNDQAKAATESGKPNLRSLTV
jgi:hypothetical protein